MAKSTGKVREFCQSEKVGTLCNFVYSCWLKSVPRFIFSGTYDIYVKIDGADKKVGGYDSAGSFGELALMYNMPRAATIVATSDGTLWAMVSTQFLFYLSRESNIWKIEWFTVFLEKINHFCAHKILLNAMSKNAPPRSSICIILHSGFLLVFFMFSRILRHLFFPRYHLH